MSPTTASPSGQSHRNPRGKILLVDDDAGFRYTLDKTLCALGFHVVEAEDGEHALEEIQRDSFDVVLLDVNMPGMGGVATCREMRKLFPTLQILVLSVCDKEADKIEALEAGADDYVTKPFSVAELAARLKAAMRRRTETAPDPAAPIIIGEIQLDPERRTVFKAKKPVHLTPKEFDLLHYLMAHAGVPIAHRKLLATVWGPEYGQELEYLRTFIKQLRKKLGDDPVSPKYLFTETWFGYRFLSSEIDSVPEAKRKL